jgi:hypothetical protein
MDKPDKKPGPAEIFGYAMSGGGAAVTALVVKSADENKGPKDGKNIPPSAGSPKP